MTVIQTKDSVSGVKVMWGDRGGVRWPRIALPLAMMLFQLGAVAWLSVIHPLSHSTPLVGTTVTSITDSHSGDGQAEGDAAVCPTCALMQVGPPLSHDDHVRSTGTSQHVVFRSPEQQPPIHPFVPANAARAPPSR